MRHRVCSMMGLAAVALWACGKEKKSQEATPSRVVAVSSKPVDDKALRAFCDVYRPAEKAVAFQMPPLVDGTLSLASGPAWINLWATWCKPCVEEIPRLLAWRQRLQKEGTPLQLHFLSVDAAVEDVQRYRAAHPELPPSPRLADASTMAAWLSGMGMRDAASVPIQLFVDAQRRVRCIRSGPVSDRDYAVVQQLLR